MTHTPWYAAGMGNHQRLIIEEGTGRNVAVAYDKKDAPLIAAAPDLLAACRRAVDLLDCAVGIGNYQDIVNAISKATMNGMTE